MRLEYTSRFQCAYNDLSSDDIEHVKKALRLLAADPRYLGLRVKRMQGTANIWEARASRSLRLTFETHGDLILLRNVGPHDLTLKNP